MAHIMTNLQGQDTPKVKGVTESEMTGEMTGQMKRGRW